MSRCADSFLYGLSYLFFHGFLNQNPLHLLQNRRPLNRATGLELSEFLLTNKFCNASLAAAWIFVNPHRATAPDRRNIFLSRRSAAGSMSLVYRLVMFSICSFSVFKVFQKPQSHRYAIPAYSANISNKSHAILKNIAQ